MARIADTGCLALLFRVAPKEERAVVASPRNGRLLRRKLPMVRGGYRHLTASAHLINPCHGRFFWGYSLTFGAGGSKFIGTLENFGLMGVLEAPSAGSTKLPAIVYAIYQSQFAALTPMIMLGAVAERGRLAPALVFTFIWATIGVYTFLFWLGSKPQIFHADAECPN